MVEIWKDIEGYEGLYQISSFGSVKSFHKDKENGKLKWLNTHRKGYYFVSLSIHGKNTYPKIHRLVALTFINNPEDKEQVNHIDGDKLNNNVNNLEWMTNQENRDHAVKHRLIARGETMHRSNLTETDIKNIRIRYKQEKISQEKLGKIYGVCQQSITNIINYKTWKHVK